MNQLSNAFSLLNLDVGDSQEETAPVSKGNGEWFNGRGWKEVLYLANHSCYVGIFKLQISEPTCFDEQDFERRQLFCYSFELLNLNPYILLEKENFWVFAAASFLVIVIIVIVQQ